MRRVIFWKKIRIYLFSVVYTLTQTKVGIYSLVYFPKIAIWVNFRTVYNGLYEILRICSVFHSTYTLCLLWIVCIFENFNFDTLKKKKTTKKFAEYLKRSVYYRMMYKKNLPAKPYFRLLATWAVVGVNSERIVKGSLCHFTKIYIYGIPETIPRVIPIVISEGFQI